MSELTRFLERRIAEGRMPGAAWWVEGPRGVIDHGAVGSAELEPVARPLRADTPFDLASLTKPLCTALLLVLLEQDGGLALDDPVSAHVPELRGSAWESVTLQQLATHTAGLPAWRPLYLEADSLEGYLELLRLSPRTLEPGQAIYSDLGYILLGAVLERTSGERLDALFRRRVAQPLRLRRTDFATGRGFSDAAATERGNAYERMLAGQAGASHEWRSATLRGEVHDGNAHALGGVAGHAGLFAPVEEVAILAREILRPWRLALEPQGRRRLLDVDSGRGDRTVGFVAARGDRAARGLLADGSPGHTGFTGTSVWLEPSEQRVFVLLTNRVHPTVEDRDFQLVRRGFHRMALRLASRSGQAG